MKETPVIELDGVTTIIDMVKARDNADDPAASSLDQPQLLPPVEFEAPMTDTFLGQIPYTRLVDSQTTGS